MKRILILLVIIGLMEGCEEEDVINKKEYCSFHMELGDDVYTERKGYLKDSENAVINEIINIVKAKFENDTIQRITKTQVKNEPYYWVFTKAQDTMSRGSKLGVMKKKGGWKIICYGQWFQ